MLKNIVNKFLFLIIVVFVFSCSKTVEKKEPDPEPPKEEIVEEPIQDKIEPPKIDLMSNLEKIGDKFRIKVKNILFEFGTTTILLNKESVNLVIDFIENLEQYEGLTYSIEIFGYADKVGSEKDNKVLSEKRAKKIYDLIIDKPFKNLQLSYVGKGEDNSVLDSTEELQGIKKKVIRKKTLLNRKVEFFFKIITLGNNTVTLP